HASGSLFQVRRQEGDRNAWPAFEPDSEARRRDAAPAGQGDGPQPPARADEDGGADRDDGEILRGHGARHQARGRLSYEQILRGRTWRLKTTHSGWMRISASSS